jgi:hypothetical protein
MRRLLLALALVLPGLASAQTVRVQPADTVQSACALTATNTSCTVAMTGKMGAAFVVTSTSGPPAGFTLIAEYSAQDPATAASFKSTKFWDGGSGAEAASIGNAALVAGLTQSIYVPPGTRWLRVRPSAVTSGTVTVTVTATDSQTPPYRMDGNNGDGEAVATGGVLETEGYGMVFNGSTWDRVRGTTLGTWVQGPGASGSAKSGNPVQTGAIYNGTLPTVTTGQTVEAQATARGELLVALSSGAVQPAITAGSAAPAYSSPALTTTSRTEGVIGAGTAPSLMAVQGAVYNSTLPTLTNGQSAAQQATSKGEHIVAFSGLTTNPCQSPNAALAMIAGTTSGTSSTQLIALSGSTKIYVCGVTIQGISGTTPTFALRYGTGSACASGTTTIIGAFTTTANATFTWGPQFVTPAGQALCYIQTGSTPVSNYAITYVQQ